MSRYLELARRADSGPVVSAPSVPQGLTVACQAGGVAEVAQRISSSGPGWVVIRSETLGGELVVFVRHASVTVPAVVRGLVRYTWTELQRLMDATPGALRALHEVKRRGWVLQRFESTPTAEKRATSCAEPQG